MNKLFEYLRLFAAKVPYGDKILHFVGGGIISASASVVGLSPLDASHLTTWVGIAKEMYDSKHPDKHTSDVWDIVATAAGGAAVSIARDFGVQSWLAQQISQVF